MSTLRLRLSRRDSRLLVDDECFDLDDDEWCLDERLSLSEEECLELDDFDDDFVLEPSWGTSSTFKIRPVVGSVVEA